MLPPDIFEVRTIEPGDKLTGLKFGNPEFTPLKTYLQKKAVAHQANSLAVTYGAFDEASGKIWGYITLACGEVVSDEAGELINDGAVSFDYRHYPAVKIARLAVHHKASGNNLGRGLVNLALGQAKNVVCPAVGCRFMVVDAKRESIGFYLKCGFTFLDTAANHGRAQPVMYLDLNKVVMEP